MADVTLNKLVFDLKNLGYGGIQPDDAFPTDRQVAYWIGQTRAQLIRQEFSKRGKVHDSWIQHWIMEFEKVDASIDPNCYPSCGSKVVKSKCKLPSTIQRGHKNGIIAVMSIDQETSYSETSFFRQKWHKYSKYTKEAPRWYIKGEYLYILGDVDNLQISALLEDPENIAECQKCEPEECWTWDSAYPITLEMSGKITDILLKRLGIIIESPGDDNNNANTGAVIDQK